MKIAKCVAVCFLVFNGLCTYADVKLPQLISNGMVLQRNTRLNIWGWASPGEKVAVKFNNKTYKTTTNADGKWQLQLSSTKAGGPYDMEIAGNNRIVLHNILLGDVWFCAGQSNMVTPMERVKEKYPEEITNAKYPQIRNFFVATVSDVSKEYDDLPAGKWVNANPDDVLSFGAVSYFFAKKLYLKYHVPIGIINSSVGGTPAQAWISADGIKTIPQYASRAEQFKDTAFLNKAMRPVVQRTNTRNTNQPDKGLAETVKWYEPKYVAEDWHKFWLPGYWADQGVKNLNGVVWFRREIDVPAAMAGKPTKLYMGRIVDADETYVNGVRVGNTTYQYPPRRYDVPAGLLKAGKNLVVIRITNNSGRGGFVPDKEYYLTDGSAEIDMRGDWQYKVGQVFAPVRRDMGSFAAAPFSAQNEPTGLYNTMVAPAVNYAVKGFVWYQGEANTGRPKEYQQVLTALIADWRNKWHDDNLPFLYAQLPNFMEVEYSPSESQWAELRESQLKTLSVPRTGMAVAIDAGEWNDIHPLNKKDVGERLALAAQKVAYNDAQVVASGPLFQSAKVEGNQITVDFSNVGSGLTIHHGKTLEHFAIAGADKRFVWATARIEGDKVIVSTPNVANPMYVRYAWADNPESANLYNKEGLPASPFRTDQ